MDRLIDIYRSIDTIIKRRFILENIVDENIVFKVIVGNLKFFPLFEDGINNRNQKRISKTNNEINVFKYFLEEIFKLYELPLDELQKTKIENMVDSINFIRSYFSNSLSSVFENPNQFMTEKDFLEETGILKDNIVDYLKNPQNQHLSKSSVSSKNQNFIEKTSLISSRHDLLYIKCFVLGYLKNIFEKTKDIEEYLKKIGHTEFKYNINSLLQDCEYMCRLIKEKENFEIPMKSLFICDFTLLKEFYKNKILIQNHYEFINGVGNDVIDFNLFNKAFLGKFMKLPEQISDDFSILFYLFDNEQKYIPFLKKSKDTIKDLVTRFFGNSSSTEDLIAIITMEDIVKDEKEKKKKSTKNSLYNQNSSYNQYSSYNQNTSYNQNNLSTQEMLDSLYAGIFTEDEKNLIKDTVNFYLMEEKKNSSFNNIENFTWDNLKEYIFHSSIFEIKIKDIFLYLIFSIYSRQYDDYSIFNKIYNSIFNNSTNLDIDIYTLFDFFESYKEFFEGPFKKYISRYFFLDIKKREKKIKKKKNKKDDVISLYFYLLLEFNKGVIKKLIGIDITDDTYLREELYKSIDFLKTIREFRTLDDLSDFINKGNRKNKLSDSETFLIKMKKQSLINEYLATIPEKKSISEQKYNEMEKFYNDHKEYLQYFNVQFYQILDHIVEYYINNKIATENTNDISNFLEKYKEYFIDSSVDRNETLESLQTMYNDTKHIMFQRLKKLFKKRMGNTDYIKKKLAERLEAENDKEKNTSSSKEKQVFKNNPKSSSRSKGKIPMKPSNSKENKINSLTLKGKNPNKFSSSKGKNQIDSLSSKGKNQIDSSIPKENPIDSSTLKGKNQIDSLTLKEKNPNKFSSSKGKNPNKFSSSKGKNKIKPLTSNVLIPKENQIKPLTSNVLIPKKKLDPNDLLKIDTLKELDRFNPNEYNNQSKEIIENKKKQIQNIVEKIKEIRSNRHSSPNEVPNEDLSMLLEFYNRMKKKDKKDRDISITQSYTNKLIEEIKDREHRQNRYIYNLFNGLPTAFSTGYYAPDVLDFLRNCILKCLETVGGINYVKKYEKNNRKIQGNSSRTTSIRNNSSMEQKIVIKGKRSLQYHYEDFLESQDLDTILIGDNTEENVLEIVKEIENQLKQLERPKLLQRGQFVINKSEDGKTMKVIFEMGDRISIFECYFGYNYDDWREIESFYDRLEPVENDEYKLLFYFQTKDNLKKEYTYYINKYNYQLQKNDTKNLYFYNKFAHYIEKIREIQEKSGPTTSRPGTSRVNSSLQG